MFTPSEYKTVKICILEYAQDIDLNIVPREKAEQRCDFDSDAPSEDPAKGASLFFDDLLDTQVRKFIPRYAETEDAFLNQLHHFILTPTAFRCW